jgi:enamine deaminase RidA (YjgF/YER057c/UK114 family)
MPLERINPDDLPTPQTYTHVVAATGSRLVFVAGQVADDAQGILVGPGDLTAQAPPGVRQRRPRPGRRRCSP